MEISYLQKTCTCGISLLIPPWPCKVSCLDHCSSGRGSHWKRWECGSIPRVGRRMCALGSPGMWGLVGHWTDGGLRIAQPAGCLTPAVPWPQHSHKPPLLSSLQTVLSWVPHYTLWRHSLLSWFCPLLFCGLDFLFKTIFIYLAVSGLCCGTEDLRCITRDLWLWRTASGAWGRSTCSTWA